MIIRRQDNESVVGSVISAVRNTFDNYLKYLSKAKSFQIVGSHIVPKVDITHKYTMGESSILNSAKFEFTTTLGLQTCDDRIEVWTTVRPREYTVSDFVLDEPIDPYRVRNWNGMNVICGFMADVLQDVAEQFDEDIHQKLATVEEGIDGYACMAEFLQLSQEFVEFLPLWTHSGNVSLYSFKDRIVNRFDYAVSSLRYGSSDMTVRILDVVEPLCTFLHSPFRYTAEKVEEEFAKILYKHLPKIPVGESLPYSECYSNLFRRLSQVFRKRISVYEDAQGFVLQLVPHSDGKISRLCFINKKGKLFRSNSNAKVAKRMELYNSIASS